MKILSVESSCDETAVAVVEDGRTILTDCIAAPRADYKPFVRKMIETALDKLAILE